MFAVIAWAGTASMACAVFDTEDEATADKNARAERYPAWTFYVAPVTAQH